MNFSSPRVVVVGCGGIARAHLGAIPPEQVVGLCDRDIGSARRMCDEFELDASVFDSLQTALEEQRPNVVVICTPPATHFELAQSAFLHGANVLCEKPLALSTSECHLLLETARERGLTLRTSAKYRFCAGAVAVKALLTSGEAGTLQSVRIAFGASFDYARSWHANRAQSGGGVWMDNGPHALDLARYFVGELHLESLGDWETEGEVETEGCVHLRSETGVHVEIILSWSRSLSEQFAVLECEHGVIEVGWSQTLWRPHQAPPRTLAGRYDKAACFEAQWRGFLNGDARFGAEDGARAVELIEAVYQATKSLNAPCPSAA